MLTPADSFRLGYHYGRRRGAVELTDREIQTRWPQADTDAFAQGMLDGLRRDAWRLNNLNRTPHTDVTRSPL